MNMIIRNLGRCAYPVTYQAMVALNKSRDQAVMDEIWFLEHPPVYTLGQAGRQEHIISPGNIPIVKTDRGGQVTYHGPGQLVCYLMLDLKRKKISIKGLVQRIENSIIDMLAGFDLDAETKKGAPGVYINERKIAALGIRVRRGVVIMVYH